MDVNQASKGGVAPSWAHLPSQQQPDTDSPVCHRRLIGNRRGDGASRGKPRHRNPQGRTRLPTASSSAASESASGALLRAGSSHDVALLVQPRSRFITWHARPNPLGARRPLFLRKGCSSRGRTASSWLDLAEGRLRLDRLRRNGGGETFFPWAEAHSSRSKKLSPPPSSAALRPVNGCVVDRLRLSDRHRGRGGRGLETAKEK